MKKINIIKLMDMYDEVTMAKSRTELWHVDQEAVKAKYQKLNAEFQQACYDSRLNLAISEVEHKARTRLVSARAVVEHCCEVRNRFGVPKKIFAGTTGSHNPHQSRFPSAYKGNPEGTAFDWEATASSWFITDIYRAYVNGSPKSQTVINLTEPAKEWLLEEMKYFWNK